MTSTGIELLEERTGDGLAARVGDRLIQNCRMFLHRGVAVPMNERQAANRPAHIPRGRRRRDLGRSPGGIGTASGHFWNRAGVMRNEGGGTARVRISPHLAYGHKGLPSLIPPDALLVVELWLRGIVQTR